MAAPTYDTKTSAIDSDGSLTSLTHTCTGSNRAAVAVCCYLESGTNGHDLLASLSFAGSGLTKKVAAHTPSGAREFNVEIWTLLAPSASASQTLSWTYTGSPSILAQYFTLMSFADVSAIGASNAATGSSNKPTMSLTSTAVDSLIAGGCNLRGHDRDPFTPGTNITERWDGDTTGGNSATDFASAGGHMPAATVQAYTFEFTGSNTDVWAIAAVELLAVVATGKANLTYGKLLKGKL